MKCRIICSVVAAMYLLSSVQETSGEAQMFMDVQGDAQIGGIAQGTLPVDLNAVSAEPMLGGEVRFRIEFAPGQAVAPPSAQASNSLAGYMDIDVDTNRSTGLIGAVDAFRPALHETPSGLGVDLFVDFASEVSQPGYVDVLRYSTRIAPIVVGTVPASFTTNALNFSIPGSLLNAAGVGNAIDVAVIVGPDDGVTDSSSGQYHRVIVPEPTVTALTLPAIAAGRRRPRK